jgi:hypothetical protein
MVRVLNTRPCSLGLPGGRELAPGENEVDEADLDACSGHPVVEMWVEMGWLVPVFPESGAEQRRAFEAEETARPEAEAKAKGPETEPVSQVAPVENVAPVTAQAQPDVNAAPPAGSVVEAALVVEPAPPAPVVEAPAKGKSKGKS